MRDFGGVLCDLDGTLIESEDLHFDAWKILLARHGIVPDEGWNNAFIGLPDVDAIRGLRDLYPPMRGIDGLLEEKQAIFRDLVRKRGKAIVYPGVAERLVELRRSGKKLAVGTNSILENTRLCLESGGILDLFEAICTLDMFPPGKPAPDIYLGAASGLALPPERCVVVEDSHAGIASGRAAGCHVLAVATTWTADKLTQADRVFADSPAAFDWLLGKGLA